MRAKLRKTVRQATLDVAGKKEALRGERLPIDIVLREQWGRITLDMLDEMRIAHKRDMEANLRKGMTDFVLREQETIRRIDGAIKRKRQGL